MQKPESHIRVSYLRDLILGGQDGLVNVLGIILGISAANGHTAIIIAASLAATFAEAVSMGAVNYTSTSAEKSRYEKELKEEYKEIETKPQEEKKEVYDIYYAKGLRGKILDEVVAEITKNKDIWVKTMMEDELNLSPVETKNLIRSSFIVAASTVIGSLIPLSPFFFLPRQDALVGSLIISGVVLFAVGVYKAKIYVGSWWKNGIQMLLIGLGAALLGFLVGLIFHAPS